MASAIGSRGRTNQTFLRYRICQGVLTGHRQFNTLKKKVADYEELLKVLISKVGMDEVKLIRNYLEKAGLLKG